MLKIFRNAVFTKEKAPAGLCNDPFKKIFQKENELYSFDVEENLLERIIYGLDDVDMTLKHKDKILAFEQTRMKNTPWIFSND